MKTLLFLHATSVVVRLGNPVDNSSNFKTGFGIKPNYYQDKYYCVYYTHGIGYIIALELFPHGKEILEITTKAGQMHNSNFGEILLLKKFSIINASQLFNMHYLDCLLN